MGYALIVSAFEGAIANGSYRPMGGWGFANKTTEAWAQGVVRIAGTFSKLAVNINATGTSRTYRFRVNGANGNQVVSPTDTTAGVYEDAVNTDALTAGDKFDVSLASTGTPTAYWFRTVFQATSNHACFYIGSPFSTGSGDNLTYYTAPCGNNGNSTTETDAQAKIRVAGTAKYLQAYVESNTRSTTCTIRTRINAGNGAQSLTVTAGATGLFEDTSNTDSLADGDLYNYSTAQLTGGGNLTLAFIGSWIENTSDSKNDLFTPAASGVSRTASSTASYAFLSGSPTLDTTEADRQIQHGFAGTASKLRINVTANTYTGSSTLRWRNGGAYGNQSITITAGATGWLEDTSNTDTFAATDNCCVELDEGTSGSLTFRCIAVTEEEAPPTTLSGHAATGSAGSLGVSAAVALSGHAATASPGSFAVSAAAALSGHAGTTGLGSFAVSAASALAGVQMTGSAGSFAGLSMSIDLPGQSATATPGEFDEQGWTTPTADTQTWTPVLDTQTWAEVTNDTQTWTPIGNG